MTEIEERKVAWQDGSFGYLFVPSPATSVGLLVLVHGQARSVERLVNAFAPAAGLAGFSVVAPIFSEAQHRGYQRLSATTGPLGAAHCLNAVCDDVSRRLGTDPQPFAIVGYSAGAQFAHRYAMAYPSRVKRLIVAGAGWYTMPDPAVAFPFGCGPSIELPDGLPQLDAFLTSHIRVMVGEGDVERDAGLRVSPALDQHQGRNRLERAQSWTAAVRHAALVRDLSSHISFELLPNCGHSAAAAIRSGKFVERTIDFCLGGAAR